MQRHLTKHCTRHLSEPESSLPKYKNMIMTVRDEDKEEAVDIGRRFEKLGYKIFATRGTADILKEAGVKAIAVNKIEQESPNLMDLDLGT